jgi:hypothetical protein
VVVKSSLKVTEKPGGRGEAARVSPFSHKFELHNTFGWRTKARFNLKKVPI